MDLNYLEKITKEQISQYLKKDIYRSNSVFECNDKRLFLSYAIISTFGYLFRLEINVCDFLIYRVSTNNKGKHPYLFYDNSVIHILEDINMIKDEYYKYNSVFSRFYKTTGETFVENEYINKGILVELIVLNYVFNMDVSGILMDLGIPSIKFDEFIGFCDTIKRISDYNFDIRKEYERV